MEAEKPRRSSLASNKRWLTRSNAAFRSVYLQSWQHSTRKTEIRDLGTIFDSNCTFHDYCMLVLDKANRIFGFVMTNARDVRDPMCLKPACCSLAHSILEYNSVTWTPLSASWIGRPESIERRFNRLAVRNLLWLGGPTNDIQGFPSQCPNVSNIFHCLLRCFYDRCQMLFLHKKNIFQFFPHDFQNNTCWTAFDSSLWQVENHVEELIFLVRCKIQFWCDSSWKTSWRRWIMMCTLAIGLENPLSYRDRCFY